MKTISCTCPLCKREFEFDNTFDEACSFTLDCPWCDGLLLYEDGKVIDFHKAMNAECPSWPADGVGTGCLKE